MAMTVEHPEIPDWGVDLSPARRPGVPYERAPRPVGFAHWTKPERQRPTRKQLFSIDIGGLTPVFGTATPPRGLSGKIRQMAYGIREERASHWAALLLADRVDAVESVLGGLSKRNLAIVAAVVAIGVAIGAARQPKRALLQWR